MLIVSIFLLILVIVAMIFILLQMHTLKSELNDRLLQASQAIVETHKTVGDRLDNTTNIFGNVQKHLGELLESNKQIFQINKEMKSFQELLRAPKFRGQVGETLLENLLSQVFPKREFYDFQYQFKSGERVDAVIRLSQRIVPIDAKFPLANFQRVIDAQDEDQGR